MEPMKTTNKAGIWLVIGMLMVILFGKVGTYYILQNALEKREKEYVAFLDDSLFHNANDIQNISFYNLQVETQKTVVENYLKEIRRPFIYLEVSCTIIEILLVFVFLAALRQRQRKKLMSNIKQFSLQENSIHNEDELVNAMYGCMQGNIDQKIKEYQTMNSYMAHEQKNLLGILYMKYNEQKDEKTLELLKKINESIEDFLTISDYSTQNLEAIDLCMVAAEVCDSYADAYEAIEFVFDEEKDYPIMAKQRWIYRAISNLVDNAIKYGEGKPIRVSIDKIRGCIVVKVEDHGCGICKEQLENIWENRFREFNRKGDGYGIGLGLVAHVCNLCDGSYYVQSTVGIGSTFVLSFPEAE